MAEEDTFKFLSNNDDENFNYTKRKRFEEDINIIWSLGLFVAFTNRSKLLMQEIRSAGIDWDEKVPDVIEQNMKKWFQKLEILDHIKVDRCVRENK